MRYQDVGVVPHGLESGSGLVFRTGKMSHDRLPHGLELWAVPLGCDISHGRWGLLMRG